MIETKEFWNGVDRRGTPQKQEPFTELTIETSWRPTDVKLEATEGFLRSYGLIPDRRR